MNRTVPVLLSAILSTVVVNVSLKAYEAKYNTYATNNLTQITTMLDGWKDGFNQLKTHLGTEVEKANTEIQRLEGVVDQYETELKTVGDTIKQKLMQKKQSTIVYLEQV